MLIISLKIVELIVSVIISIVVNPTFWHNVYLVSMCTLIKSIVLLVGFESLFFRLHPLDNEMHILFFYKMMQILNFAMYFNQY
jgi:hypothetical protein